MSSCYALSCAQAERTANKRGGGLDVSARAITSMAGGGGGCCHDHGTVAAGTGCGHHHHHQGHRPHPTASASTVPVMAAGAYPATSMHALATARGFPPPADRNAEQRGGGGGGVKRPGVPLGAAEMSARTGNQHDGQGEGCCYLDQEFEGITLNSG